ncbi:hypothetical protein KL86PLE_110028 [uncultured Pleomorphomonas sp.]|uniref:Uncharacterized protein n=1 Tax=uncultured Pleomorphomonas sp. TaxID=442121 RepID=A0A212L740_9HYPH|nr:hypothetical protein [uncultured Pleomorphomonas sp.]SCM73340.1 hypothetical protein KL86PLE_110028 [uncultured Pleomorphomonas sp.]
MKRIGPYGDEDGEYVQGDARAGIKGSYLDARAVDHVQKEVQHVIEEAGLLPSSSDLTQLYQAIAEMIAAATPSLAAYLLKAGGTMTGLLTLSGAPTANLHAATKAYVDGLADGVGQTWQDVSASRVAGTVYQNTTGRAIKVLMVLANNTFFMVSADNATWLTLIDGDCDQDAGANPGEITIPPGYYYKATGILGPTWKELR